MAIKYPVSIAIPVYIADEIRLEWLKECLESCAKQEADIVIYDDGSPLAKEVYDICKSYNSLFASETVNRGASYARNVCAGIAETALIFPLDCDDTLVEGAIEQLYSVWDGVPVYPDIAKFGNETIPHWNVMDFDCEHVRNIVGFTSVNVLHSVEQWSKVGGYDINLDFYEDGEYNARLFGRYCGKRFPKPLVNYRQHDLQRVVQYNDRSHYYADKILNRIRSMDMACPGCGKRSAAKNTQNTNVSRMLAQSPAPKANVQVGSGAIDLPTELDGKVLVQYFGGKGMAKHTKRGPSSNRPYAVKYMDFLYVLPADAVDRVSPGHPFQKVVKSNVAPVALPEYEPKPVEIAQAPAPAVSKREPVANVIRTPIMEAEDLPDISKLPLKKLQMIDITPEQAVRLLAIEESGKHRSQVIVWLKNRIKND